MKTKNHTQTISTLAALAGLALAAGAAHAATMITNGDFESDTFTGNNYTGTITGWTEEDAGEVYVQNIDVTDNTPVVGKMLYLNSTTSAVHQDLSHNWSSSDSFTLSFIAMNPEWDITNNVFKVQLRQADDTVLWDSGTQDVSGTVTAGKPNSYTGTGHLFSFDIDASAFAGAGVVEGSQINLRIAAVTSPVFVDDVSLTVSAVPEPSTTALLGLGGLALIFRRRK